MFSLAVCNSNQGNGVFLGGSQQHLRKVAYFLGGQVEPPRIQISLAVYYNPKEMINSLAVGFWHSRKSWTLQGISILV